MIPLQANMRGLSRDDAMSRSDTNTSRSPLIIVTSEMRATGETGVQTHFNDAIDYFRKSKCRVEFVGPDESRSRYHHLRIPRGLLARLIPFVPEFAFSLLRSIDIHATRRELRRRLSGEASWCVYAQDPVTARAALGLKCSSSHRVVLAVHFNKSQAEEMVHRGVIRRDGKLYQRIRLEEIFVLQGVDHVIAFSSFMRTSLLAQASIEEKISVIPNTAHMPRPLSPSESLMAADLVAVGSLEPRKNQAFLLHVLASAKERGRCYTLDLIGSGESQVALERLAEDLGISSQVHFLGRVTPASSYLQGHTLFVHAALMENMPIALIEALAVGLPILAPAIGGIPEIFQHGVEGYFWDLENLAYSTQLLIRLMEDDQMRKKMSAAAQQRHADYFSPAIVFARLAEAIQGRNERSAIE